MFDSHFRSPFQNWIVDPCIHIFRLSRCSPTFLTLLALITGLLIPFFLFYKHSLLACIALILSGFFDIVDGSVARKTKSSSSFGAVMDITSDRLVEFAVILGLYLYEPMTRGYLTLWMLGSSYLCVTSFLVVSMFCENTSEKSFHYSPGIMERTEAFLFFLLLILIPSQFFLFSVLYSALVLLTALIRIIEFKARFA